MGYSRNCFVVSCVDPLPSERSTYKRVESRFWLDSGRGFQVKALKPFPAVPSSLVSGVGTGFALIYEF